MVSARFRIAVLSALLVLLTGCLGWADLTSEIEFSDKSKAQEIVTALLPRVFAFAAELGGVCKTYTRGTGCRFPNRHTADATNINIAVSESDGLAYISIHSAITSWALFPISQERMRRGELVPEFHKQWEEWAVRATAEFEPQVRTRRYSSLGVIGSF